jgi:Icc-related predicted phosphoesterase
VKLLLVSDLHYTMRQLDWVVAVAGDFDLVVVAGDLLDISSIVDPEAQVAVVLEYVARIADKTSVAVCSGNHDLDGRNDLDEQYASWLAAAAANGALVDGSRFDFGDTRITVCPWWDGPRTRDALGAQLASDAETLAGRNWIWVYHAPPDNSPTSWTGKRYYGDEALSAWIAQYQPTIVLTGHVHQAPFSNDGAWAHQIGSTWVINAGRQIGPVPAFVEIDTETGAASWSSSLGVDEMSLAGVVAGV